MNNAWLLVFVGGGIGSSIRFAFSKWLDTGGFPWPTVISNLLASLILGFLAKYTLSLPKTSAESWYWFVGTGICGGFSTFSTFSLETLKMLQNDQPLLALTSVALQVIGCLLVVYVGWSIANQLG